MSAQFQSFSKVHIFWEGHKNFAKSPPIIWLAVHRTNNWWRFCKILWPSQNILTLLVRPHLSQLFWILKPPFIPRAGSKLEKLSQLYSVYLVCVHHSKKQLGFLELTNLILQSSDRPKQCFYCSAQTEPHRTELVKFQRFSSLLR